MSRQGTHFYHCKTSRRATFCLRPSNRTWERFCVLPSSSRETKLAATSPLHVVCAWIGNTATIAQQHYLQVTEDYFDRAGSGAKSGAPEAPNEAQKPTANNRKDWLESPEVELDYEDVQLVAIGDEANQYAWRDSNPQPTAP
jgi:hypothetical protein